MSLARKTTVIFLSTLFLVAAVLNIFQVVTKDLPSLYNVGLYDFRASLIWSVALVVTYALCELFRIHESYTTIYEKSTWPKILLIFFQILTVLLIYLVVLLLVPLFLDIFTYVVAN